MHVYVTGGTGFVGSALVEKLAEDHQVTVGDLAPKTSARSMPSDVGREQIDVTDPSTLYFDGVDAFVHLVALSPLWKPPSGTSHYKIHVEGTRNVLEAAEDASVDHVTHMSALGADPAGPNAYIRAKGAAEQAVERSSLPSAIIRPSVIVGEHDEMLSQLLQVTKYAPALPLPLGGTTQFQPVVIDDIASMLADAVETRPDRSFNIGGPDILSLNDMASLAFRANDREPRIISIPGWFVKAAAWLGERTSLLPFGMDQYRALEQENTLGDLQNDCKLLGFSNKDLTAVESYLNNHS